MSNNTQRTRTYSWEDPKPGFQQAQGMTGMEYMQAVANGKIPLPPIVATMGFLKFEILGEGKVMFTAQPEEYHFNPIGLVHGGFAATLLDVALGFAIHTRVTKATSYTTVQLNINYIRGLRLETGVVRCIGEAIHIGRRIATGEARLLDAQDKLYAHATTTCLVFSE